MPRNQFQRMVFALITVVITVHAYVFYSLYVVNGATLMSITGESGVLSAIAKMGGVYMFGKNLPIWAVVITEFVFAYVLEVLVGSPCSFKLACKAFDPRKTHPVIFESAIISATVAIMCPAMSFIAAWLYFPYYEGFNILTLLANWIKHRRAIRTRFKFVQRARLLRFASSQCVSITRSQSLVLEHAVQI